MSVHLDGAVAFHHSGVWQATVTTTAASHYRQLLLAVLNKRKFLLRRATQKVGCITRRSNRFSAKFRFANLESVHDEPPNLRCVHTVYI